ncbi:MAG: hypothetical protein AAGA44_00195 [Pseudomonadota bacterium]
MKWLQVLGMLLCSAVVMAPAYTHDGDGGCMQGAMAQFGRYIGDWRIRDESLSQDGSTWTEGTGARWRFECVGNGVAVQDFWMPFGGGYGTNLRTYNPSSDRWEIVWAATQQSGLQRISARENDKGEVVMSIDYPTTPQPRRIIFFPPTDDGWNWAMQWSLDDGETWIDVYRITATPWSDD